MTTIATGLRDAVLILAADLEDNRAGLPVVKYDRKYETAPFLLIQIQGASATPSFYEIPVLVILDAVDLIESQDEIARLADLAEKTFDELGYGPAEFTIEFLEDRGAWAASWRIEVPRSW